MFNLKQMLLRKMLKSQLKNVPAAEQERLLTAFEKNPKLFENIAREVQEKMKQGKNQMLATMEVTKKYQQELKDALGQ